MCFLLSYWKRKSTGIDSKFSPLWLCFWLSESFHHTLGRTSNVSSLLFRLFTSAVRFGFVKLNTRGTRCFEKKRLLSQNSLILRACSNFTTIWPTHSPVKIGWSAAATRLHRCTLRRIWVGVLSVSFSFHAGCCVQAGISTLQMHISDSLFSSSMTAEHEWVLFIVCKSRHGFDIPRWVSAPLIWEPSAQDKIICFHSGASLAFHSFFFSSLHL